MSGIAYDGELLRGMIAHCEAAPAEEACGFVVRRGEALEVVAIPNVADRYHAADPVHFPRTSRTSYVMDPKGQLGLQRELRERGGELVAVWHSHVEVGAYFSEKDRSDAVVDGAQAVPGAEYVVLGVRGGRVREARRYEYRGGAFVETVLEVPESLEVSESTRSPRA